MQDIHQLLSERASLCYADYYMADEGFTHTFLGTEELVKDPYFLGRIVPDHFLNPEHYTDLGVCAEVVRNARFVSFESDLYTCDVIDIYKPRHPKYDYTKNPLFTKEEAEYWNSIILPNDREYRQLIELTKQMDKYALHEKIGHEKYVAFATRVSEDDMKLYSEYFHIDEDELPF